MSLWPDDVVGEYDGWQASLFDIMRERLELYSVDPEGEAYTAVGQCGRIDRKGL